MKLPKKISRLQKDSVFSQKVEYAINRSLIFWRCFDYVHNSNHERNFTALYLTPEYANKSVVQMCFILNLSDSTFYRYRKNYEDSVEFMLRESEGESSEGLRGVE